MPPRRWRSSRQLKERAASRSTESQRDLGYGRNWLDNLVSSNWYWLEDWARTSMSRWNLLWLAKATAELELRELSLDELRRAEQPDYAAAVEKKERDARTLQFMTDEQVRLDEAASLKWKAAGLRALAAFFTFVFFVWIAGLMVEGGWLTIRVAADVRRLRETSEQQPAAGRSDAQQPRVPIRGEPPQVAAAPMS